MVDDTSRKSWAKGIGINVHSSNNDETEERGVLTLDAVEERT